MDWNLLGSHARNAFGGLPLGEDGVGGGKNPRRGRRGGAPARGIVVEGERGRAIGGGGGVGGECELVVVVVVVVVVVKGYGGGSGGGDGGGTRVSEVRRHIRHRFGVSFFEKRVNREKSE